MTKIALFLCLLATPCLRAQEVTETVAPPMADPAVPDDGVRVAVLGFHDFSETLPETAMRSHTSKFRKQMETIRQLGLNVIPMEDFLAWKRGEKAIPQKSIVITLDDGWKSVYTDAYPVLKEFGYPFTIFLYKNYVDGGGKALTTPMIEEMLKNGASIGSHSVSHPFPIEFKNHRKKGPADYDAYLRLQMGESRSFLTTKFPGQTCLTYAYPGGYYTEEMVKLAPEVGYTHLFTVVPGKIKRGMPDTTLPRYIILGNYDKIFDMAVTFRESQSEVPAPGSTVATLTQTTPYPVQPEPGAIINSRLPEISADLSKVPGLDPASLVMKISGYGVVPANFVPETGKFSWTINRRLRQPVCQVAITWKDTTTGKEVENPLRWSFQIDKESAYLPDGE